MNRAGLPEAAVALLSRIEGMVGEAEVILDRGGSTDEVSYALRETRRRYLPDTISSYLDIPASQRDASAQEMLVGQLTLLERATAKRLATLTESVRMKQSANGLFLSEKFGTVDSLPAVPDDLPIGEAPPQTLVSRLFEQLDGAVQMDPAKLIEHMAERLSAALPRLVNVTRGFMGGKIRGLVVEVPRRDRILRYALQSANSGVEASCTNVVRGVALKTERVAIEEWLSGLLEDLTDYVARDQSGREALDKFLRR